MKKNIILGLLTLSVAATAFANPEDSNTQANKPRLLEGFICSNEPNGFSDYVNTHSVVDKTGSLMLKDSIREDGICIKEISVIGSFGIVGVAAQLCNEEVEKFTEYVTNNFGVQAVKSNKEGVISEFKVNKKGLVIYKGKPTNGIDSKPDPKSNSISYICMAKAGGHQ